MGLNRPSGALIDAMGEPLGATHGSSLPLGCHTVVDTYDLDEAESEVGKIFCAHRLTPVAPRARGFHAVHNNACHDGFSINYVAYGADVEIDPGRLDRFFLFQLPLSGAASVRCGKGIVEASPRTASLLSPTLPTRMRWREGTAKLIVLIDRDVVESHLASLLGRVTSRIEFMPAVDLETPAGMALRAQAFLIQSLTEQAAAAGQRWSLAQRQLRDGLIGSMLAALPHSHSASLARPAAAPAPAHVRRAEAYIAASISEGFSVQELAAAAGVGLRTLQTGFRQFRGKTIGEAILDARLGHWRRLLSDPGRSDGVADLALSAGLPHAGRAASAYRHRYGEPPSATRRRHRGPRLPV